VPKRYSEEDVDRGLIAAATLGLRPAERETGIPESTLRGWIDNYPERYSQIRTEEAPKWRERAAAAFEDVVEGLTDVEWDLLKRMKEQAESLDGKDTANALKNVAIAKGINTDKANVLRGMPAATTEHKFSFELVTKAIAALEAMDTVEGTAEEIPVPDGETQAFLEGTKGWSGGNVKVKGASHDRSRT
jgi:hypothetical protein